MPKSQNGTAYDLYGPQHAPTIILIHGLGLTREITWSGIIPQLSERFHVIAYDLCGHGETKLPDRPVNLSLLSEQVIALMDEFGIEKAALVGFSLGGMINRRCAMDHADRVAALAILNSPHERGDFEQQLVEQRARDTGKGGPAANIEVTLARWFTAGFRENDPATVEKVRQIVLANDHANYAAHRLVLAEGVKELIRPAPPITQPTLVMTCENDSGSTPEMSHAIVSEIESSEVCIIPDLQHLGLLERPDLFAGPVLEFFERKLH